MPGVQNVVQDGVDRILQSDTFRNAPSSRRLLKYLADRLSAGDAEQLKEYTIGVDAFGKAPDYDPRVDSTVRIQIGRLRQKLADYYQSEGRLDPVVIDLPRGRFKLSGEPRPVPQVPEAPEAPQPTPLASEPAPRNPWRLAAVVLAGFLLLVLAAWAVTASRTTTPRPTLTAWTPELEELWQPFLGNRSLVVAVGNPLFLQFDNKILYRDLSIEKWEDLLKSPNLQSVNRALGTRDSRPVYYYAAIGDLSAAFLLGQRLGPRQPNMSVVRSTQLPWQQMADANVLFLGPPRFFGEKLGSMPVSLEVIEMPDGFHNVHPQPGEQAVFKYREPEGFFAEDGEACVLITRTPGPEGNTDLATFAGNSTFGRLGAVKAFTDPVFVQTLVQRMRTSNGHIPKYFQVLLKVKYKGGVPTETTYLLHRELRRH